MPAHLDRQGLSPMRLEKSRKAGCLRLGKLDDAAPLQINVEIEYSLGGGESMVVRPDHEEHAMELSAVEVQQATKEGHGLPLKHFAVKYAVYFGGEQGAVGSFAVGLAHIEPREDAARSLLEQNTVIGNVKMPIVIEHVGIGNDRAAELQAVRVEGNFPRHECPSPGR